MSDLSAQHYLGIYRTRLKLAEKGTTHPKPEVVEGTRQLIAGLSDMSPDAMVRLEVRDGRARFKEASTGNLLVEFDFTDAYDRHMAYSISHTPAFWDQRFGTPECARNYHCYAYEYLDDLGFMRPAKEVFGDWQHAERLIEEVGARLKNLGWEGDGEFQLLWFPPFAGAGPHDNFGTYALHVKQRNDGISWIACPVPLPFHRLFKRDTATYPPPSARDPLSSPPTGLERRAEALRNVLYDIFNPDERSA